MRDAAASSSAPHRSRGAGKHRDLRVRGHRTKTGFLYAKGKDRSKHGGSSALGWPTPRTRRLGAEACFSYELNRKAGDCAARRTCGAWEPASDGAGKLVPEMFHRRNGIRFWQVQAGRRGGSLQPTAGQVRLMSDAFLITHLSLPYTFPKMVR